MHLLRKILAATLSLVALALALWPGPSEVDVVVAARDLAPGVPLGDDDLRVQSLPPPLSPAGAVTLAEARGRTLTGAARSGEPLTDARLGRADPDSASVAVRLADSGVVGLLRPGSRVDVVGPEARVLARDASVVAVRDGEVVVILVDRASATRVAAESLAQSVAVTLR